MNELSQTELRNQGEETNRIASFYVDTRKNLITTIDTRISIDCQNMNSIACSKVLNEQRTENTEKKYQRMQQSHATAKRKIRELSKGFQQVNT